MLSVVTAVIKPHMLDSVKEALRAIGVTGLTATEVKGFGRQGGKTETYRGAEYTVDFLPKIRVDVLVGAESVDEVMEAIANSARTGKIGDGKIWAVEATRAMRIRTGEFGTDAI